MDKIELAVEKLRGGKPVFIFDFEDRECEVDVVFYAPELTPEHVRFMRQVAGGLICFVTKYEVGRALGLDLQARILSSISSLSTLVKRPRYGDEPAFSLWVNHVSVKTGIRDVDRCTTIKKLAEVVKLVQEGRVDEGRKVFYREFYSPGHVPVLLGRVGQRFGHTELSLMLAEIGNLLPALVICEMLGDSLEAATIQEVEKLATRLNTVLLSGEEIVKYYKEVKSR